jgi:hypothetical protein
MHALLDCIKERTPLRSDGDGLELTVNGWRIKPKPSRGGSGSLEQRMIIKEIHDDWFLCLPYDKDGQHPAADVATSADYIKVAKPYELRLTPWDGQTVDGITFDYSDESHRTATQGAIIEQHVIVRPWYVGEIIVAATQITGGTDQDDFAAKALEWEDTNSAAHAWAMVDINDTGGITPQSLNVRSVSALLPVLSSGGTRPQISLAAHVGLAGDYGSVTVDSYGLVTAGGPSSGAPVGRWEFDGITRAHHSRKAYITYGARSGLLVTDPTTLTISDEFTDGFYAFIWSNTGGSNFGVTPGQTLAIFGKFIIPADLSNLTEIRPIAFSGVDEVGPIMEIYLWNFTGSVWDLAGQSVDGTHSWLTGSIASAFTDYILADDDGSHNNIYTLLIPSADSGISGHNVFLDNLALELAGVPSISEAGDAEDGIDGPPVGRWDFNGITSSHSSRKAWVGDTATPSLDDPATLIAAGTELSDGEYVTLHAEDASGTDFTSGGSVTPFFLFKFLVNAQPLATKISTRGIVRMGVGETSSIVLQIWNGVAWAGIGTVVADEDNWVMLGDARESLLADVIDSNGFLWLMLSTAVNTTLGVDYVAVDIETAAAPNGEAGPGGGGMGGTVTDTYYARSDGTDLVDGIIRDEPSPNNGVRVDNVLNAYSFADLATYVSLTADNQTIDATHGRLKLYSDDLVAANRTFHISDGYAATGGNDGLRLLLYWDLHPMSGVGAGELLAADTNLVLSANWTPVTGDMLQLMWDATLGKWLELFRYP